jgi:hypothetical protein
MVKDVDKLIIETFAEMIEIGFNLVFDSDNIERYIKIDMNRLKHIIKKYYNSLVIKRIENDIVDEALKYLDKYTYESYKKMNKLANKLNGINDIYDENNLAFETYDRRANYDIVYKIDRDVDFYFKVSLFEEYINLIKYHSQVLEEDMEHEYQFCEEYFYNNVLSSVPLNIFVLLRMILYKYPEKLNYVNEYLEKVIQTFDFPN